MMEGGHRVGRARRHSLAHIPASVYIWSLIYPPVLLFVCLYVPLSARGFCEGLEVYDSVRGFKVCPGSPRAGSLSPGSWLTAHVGTVSKFREATNLGFNTCNPT